jgi:hypothetical protein
MLNDHKMYQSDKTYQNVKYTKWSKIYYIIGHKMYQHFPFQGPPKYWNRVFGMNKYLMVPLYKSNVHIAGKLLWFSGRENK